MQPLNELKLEVSQVSQLAGVLTDIDDTLTTRGKLSVETYAAMQALRDAGLKVIPITGGAASLALHAARLWPVDGAIGESGALYYHHDSKQLHTHYWDDAASRAQKAIERDACFKRIQQAVPRVRLASDQALRLCDLAINLREDLLPEQQLSNDELMQVRKLLMSEGYTLRQSSIHLNAWKSTYDKLPMTQRMLKQLWEVDLDDLQQRKRWLYVGDAPNDEAMFAYFPLSVGVANVKPHLPGMLHHPAYVTTQPYGAGFVELVQLLLHTRLLNK